MTSPAPRRRSRKKTIIAGSVAGVVMLAVGLGVADALSGGGSASSGGSGGSSGGSSAICPQSGLGAVGTGAIGLQVPNGDCIVGSTAYSQDSKLLAGPGGNNLNAVYIWNGVTHKYLTTLTLPSGDLEGGSVLAFSANDKILTDADFFGNIYQWNMATRSGHYSNSLMLSVDASVSNNVAISSDGTTLAVTDNAGDGTAIINLATQAITADLTDPDSAPLLGVNSPGGQFPGTALSLSADGSRLTVGDSKGNLYVWNVRSRQVIATLGFDPAKAGENRDAAAVISADGNLAFIPDGPNGLANSLWNVASRANVTPSDARWPRSGAAYFSAAGQFIATERSDASGADLWSAATRAHLASVSFDSSVISIAGVSPNGKEILTTDGNSDPWVMQFP
jgi:WD40 repeat protein